MHKRSIIADLKHGTKIADARTSACKVKNIYIVQEELEEENIRMSDHLGLVAVLEKPGV